jgi:hypothetical protein
MKRLAVINVYAWTSDRVKKFNNICKKMLDSNILISKNFMCDILKYDI